MSFENDVKYEKWAPSSLARTDHVESAKDSDNYALIRRRQKYLGGSLLFYRDPVHIVRGEGIWLYDQNNNRLLDCYNNVASVGHCHPRVVEALSKQAATLNTHTRYLHEKVVDYAEHLASTLPGDLEVCLFVCSGTEANDLAMRIARTVTGNHGAIVMENAYHGNSTLIYELSPRSYSKERQPEYVATVEPPNTYRGSFRKDSGEADDNLGEKYANLLDDAIDQLNRKGHGVAAFMCDTIFDSQGALQAPKDYFQRVYKKVRAAGGLCIADEVQPGFGRTGEHMWGFENYGVVPDIVTLGKPMGDGHPVAGVVTTRDIADKFAKNARYFNTFAGNPVSAAVGKTVLEVIEAEGLQRNAKEVGAYLQEKLEVLMGKHPIIGNVRGLGLFLGVELVRDRETREPASEEALSIVEQMRHQGILIGAAGPFNNVLKVRPPLVFSRDNADLLVEKLDKLLSEQTA